MAAQYAAAITQAEFRVYTRKRLGQNTSSCVVYESSYISPSVGKDNTCVDLCGT